jgi:NADH:ubiquinone oxidoreductase subunit F (NADH-binding)
MTSVTERGVQHRLLNGTDRDMPDLSRDQIIGLARDSGLTGRGGAGFPMWRKLAAVVLSGHPPVVIANAAEGEPASGKDRALVTCQPHLVLDGLQLVARACGASVSHVYGTKPALASIAGALRGRHDAIPVRLTPAPAAFVAGERSAAASAVAGRGAVPQDKLLRTTATGTLVQNVETLAHLALIARHGPHWFRECGTSDEPGTFLATVGGAVAAPGIVEAGYGVALGELVAAAGGPASPLSAVLIGGYHGGWVPADPSLEVSRAGLAPFGATPGAGVVVALPANACGLRETARIAGYLAGETTGQCGPCLNGLPRLAGTLADLAYHRIRPGLPAEVARLDGTARLIASAMRTFQADVAAHLNGRCTTEVAR